ncbi:protein ALP1-like [Pyrus x bretschneideri]|uniref:protein ALP1-like n=1 Tax=Pyrus x bretschneideri TaxID=225117 RepID=UPI00202FCFF0|nr:protein ALP1-like [Pyrus x bretschneideri]
MMAKHGLAVLSKIRESTRFSPYLKDCIRAIDGTHIPASVSGYNVSSYRNRKGVISQNVLAACNFDLEFMYVLSGWEGSSHDSRVLNDALTRRNGLKVPQGKFFIVDCGFPNRHQFLAPYRGIRYHLQEIAPPFPYATQVEVVLACAVVHNFLHKECRSNEFPIEPDDESSSSPPLSASEGDLDQDFQTQEQQRNIANEWRYNITLDMWRDAHNDNNVNRG